MALFFEYPKSHVAQSRTDHLFSSRADRLPRPLTDQKVEVLPPYLGESPSLGGGGRFFLIYFHNSVDIRLIGWHGD